MADREFDNVKINVEFEETANRQQISSGDKLNTLFGKIRKWLSDLKPVAFSGKYSDLTEKATSEDVGALSLTGGTLEGNANPLLTLQRTGGNFSGLEFRNPSGHLFAVEGYSAEDGTGKQLNIYARDLKKSLLRINENGRVIYDYKTKDEKEILVNGEALPLTGGEISGQLNIKSRYFPLINLVRAEYGETAAIQLTNGNENQKGFLLEGYLKDSEGSERNFHIRDRILNKELFMVSPTERKVYDKDSGSLKKILVEGEALSITGGTLKSTTDYFPLHLERTTGDTGCGLEFRGTAGAVGNIQITYDAYANNENEFRCFVKNEDKKDVGVLYVSRERRKIYCKETGGIKNIVTDYEVPFRFGIEEGDYGYYRNDTEEFTKMSVPTTTSLAVTEEGVSSLDGTVGKMLNDKGSQISLYQADDGVWHFRDWAGADTVIPFKKERKTIDLGKFDGRNSNSIDIKSYIENYQDINSDNFYAKNIGLYWVSGDLGNNHLTFLYDNLTGILNISKFSGQAPNNISFFAYYNIFLVI